MFTFIRMSLSRLASTTGLKQATGWDLSGLYRFTTVDLLRKGHWQIVASHASKIEVR